MLIRHHDPAAIKGFQNAGPRGHFNNRALFAAVEFDIITNRGLAFQQQDHARYKVRRNLLQAQTNTHTQSTAQNGNRGQIDAHDRHQQ